MVLYGPTDNSRKPHFTIRFQPAVHNRELSNRRLSCTVFSTEQATPPPVLGFMVLICSRLFSHIYSSTPLNNTPESVDNDVVAPQPRDRLTTGDTLRSGEPHNKTSKTWSTPSTATSPVLAAALA